MYTGRIMMVRASTDTLTIIILNVRGKRSLVNLNINKAVWNRHISLIFSWLNFQNKKAVCALGSVLAIIQTHFFLQQDYGV